MVTGMKTALDHPEPNKDFIAFKECAEWLSSERPAGVREGQFLFNHLHDFYPVMANALRGTMHDPFYDDSLIYNFWAFVRENWYLTNFDELLG